MMRTLIFSLACWLLASGLAAAQTPAEDTLHGHFAAITAEDYVQADQYFSAAFLRAFKADVERLNRYYFSRRIQLEPGYAIVATEPLTDTGRETCRITVDFQDPNPEAPVTVAERMYYYLIREKAAGGPLVDNDGRAWRIDICDAVRFETLAEARRRPYLYTREAWDESGSRELKSFQGLFQIHVALAAFYQKHGQYPFRLLGGDNRRDELISEDILLGKYPTSGYDNRAMRQVDAGKRSPGDFAYYSVDADGDGVRESYWLLLHGALPENYYFDGLRVVYVLAPDAGLAQVELAQGFADYWQQLNGDQLAYSPAFLENQTAGQQEFVSQPPESMLASLPPTSSTEPRPAASAEEELPPSPTVTTPVEIASVPTSVEELQPIVPNTPASTEEVAPEVAETTAPAVVVEEPPAVEPAPAVTEPPPPSAEQVAEQAQAAGAEVITGAEQVQPEAAPAEPALPTRPAYPEPGEPLVIYAFGW